MTPLCQRMIEDMQIRNLAVNTQRAYCGYVSLFAQHFHKSPDRLGPKDILTYRLHLVQDRHLASSSISFSGGHPLPLEDHPQAEWDLDDIIPTCRQQHKLPVVLSPREVANFLDAVKSHKHRVILTICYAAGPRISEAVHLSV